MGETVIRNQDDKDEKIKTHIVRHPGISFTQLVIQTGVAASTLRYRLMTLEFENEVVCRKQRNQNQYFPKNENEKETAALTHGTKPTNTVEAGAEIPERRHRNNDNFGSGQ